MTKEWVSRPFASCIDQVAYTQKIQRKDFLSEGKYPIVSQEAELINGYWDNEADVFRTSMPVVLFGDHTRSLKYVDFDFALGADGVKILKPNDFLDPKFFYFQLQSVDFPSLGYARHYRLLKQIEIKFPPLPEQQRIVALLDEAFAGLATAKANAERNLQNARAVFRRHLEHVFNHGREGWEETTLGEIGRVSMCKRIFKEETNASGDIPFYKIGTFGKAADAFILAQLYNEYKEKYSFPRRGAILLSAAGTIGRRVIYDGEPAYFQDSNIVWIDNDETKVLNAFLYHFYGASEWKPTSGATISRLYNDDLRRICVRFPTSLQEQSWIACQLDKVAKETQRLAQIYERKLAALDELKKSFLQQAFNGEL